MVKKVIMLLCVVTPLHAMFYRTTSKAARKKPATVTSSSVRYQKAAAAQKFLQHAQVHQQSEKIKREDMQKIESAQNKNEPLKQGFVLHQQSVDEKRQRLNFERSSVSTKGAWGALLTALGLGWLWYSSEDQEADELLKHCRESNAEKNVDPFNEFTQFVEKHGGGRRAEQLFERMIEDSKILFNMMVISTELKAVPPLVIPFIKSNYYTLACNKSSNAVYMLDRLIHLDSGLKKDLTLFAIRDMEKLCKDAQSDLFFSSLLIDNSEAVNGFLKKARGHVEELVATKVGRQLIDNSLVQYSMDLAKERANILVDPTKNFDLSAFNSCMMVIKDDVTIQEKIKKSYKHDDLHSLLKNIVYQKHCQNCAKDDRSYESLSLRTLVHNINFFAAPDKNIFNYLVVPDKGLSHMVMEAFEKEERYGKDDYYVFYHGQSSKLGFQQRLFGWLLSKNDDMAFPVIYPLPQTQEEKRADELFLRSKKGKMVQSGGERTHSLYAVVDLFANIVLKLAANNMSAGSTPSITTQEVCRYAGQEMVYETFKKELESLEREYHKLHQHGQLLQFRVKKDKLEEYAFPSNDDLGKLKVKDMDTLSDIRSIVNTFHDKPETIENAHSFSVGIIINSDLSKPDSGIKCSIINSVDPTEWTMYEKKERLLRNKVAHYLQRKQSFR